MKKSIFLLVLALLCALCFSALAEESTAFTPLTLNDEPAPYPPHAECYLPDNAGYHDDSLDIRIEHGRAYDSDYMAVYVRLSDPSQLRCGMVAPYPSKKTAMVVTMAERFEGVLTINGDYFNYHDQGIVVRNGERLRFRPTKNRDTLIIDDKGDFTILPKTTKEDYEAFEGNVMHAFCFGPSLVRNGVAATHAEVQAAQVDIGKNKKTQRLALCQLDTLYYMIVCTEGPSGGGDSKGVTIEEMAKLCESLGAVSAYNLDGGNSAAVVLGTEKLNNVACTKKRMVGDCIFFATLVP